MNKKYISMLMAATFLAANPFSGAYAAPLAQLGAGAGVPDFLVQVKEEHHEGHHGGGHHGGKHGGGHHGGGKHDGGKHGGHHDHHDHKGKPHDHHDKHHGDHHEHHDKHGDHHDHHDHHGHYHGWHHHEHHHWRWHGGVWVRPADYWWIAGGAIAAGAAIGYLSAADAGAWAYDPPAATGYCWFYTDASRENGFWDQCPGADVPAVAPASDTQPVVAPDGSQSSDQPNMQDAIANLNDALIALKEATPNKGGHRDRAMEIIQQAIDQVEQGIAWRDEHR